MRCLSKVVREWEQGIEGYILLSLVVVAVVMVLVTDGYSGG